MSGDSFRPSRSRGAAVPAVLAGPQGAEEGGGVSGEAVAIFPSATGANALPRRSPVVPCHCGCWPDLAASPEAEIWMAVYLDLLDRDVDAAQQMLLDYLGPLLRRAA